MATNGLRNLRQASHQAKMFSYLPRVRELASSTPLLHEVVRPTYKLITEGNHRFKCSGIALQGQQRCAAIVECQLACCMAQASAVCCWSLQTPKLLPVFDIHVFSSQQCHSYGAVQVQS